MGTITIQSNNSRDLQFLRDLADRLGLKAKIDVPETNININQLEEPTIDYEDTANGVVEAVKRGLKEVELAKDGKIKLQTLNELLNEFEDED